jgi:cold-inducible RNA-binding protein
VTTRLFVGNLSNDITEAALRAAFAAHGTVSEVHVVQDRYTGRSRGFAFVTMGSPEEAATAVERMNGAALNGRTIHVSEGTSPAVAGRAKR